MADLPAPLQYGSIVLFVTGPFADDSDDGPVPNLVGLNGSLTVTPLVDKWKVITDDGVSRLIVGESVVCRVVDGVVYGPGGDGDTLQAANFLASRTAGLSGGLSAVQYKGTFKPTSGTVVQFPRFEVPVDGTVNLADNLDYSSPATQTLVSEATRVAAEAAAAAAAASAAAAEVAAALLTGLAPDSITYNLDGSVATSAEGSVTTTYTYNADGTVNTETRLGKTKTWSYDGSGNPTGSVVA